MSELATPAPLEEPRPGLLSRAVGVRLGLRWELIAFASLVILGAGFRFWDLGSRALHHDESLHGFYSYNLFRGHGYVHDPLLHGPFQFFGTAASFFLAGGASDYTVRVFPALFGTLLILLPFFLRHRLGSLGAVFAAGLIAFSPTLLYFSRFARNDIYIAVFTLGLVVALWRYVDERKPLYLYLAAGILGLSFATKENTFLHAALLLIFLNAWLAADFVRQTLQRTGETRSIGPLYFLIYFPWAWLLTAFWPFIRGLRERVGLQERHPAGDFLIILGTFTLPQLAASLQVPLETWLGIELADAAQGAFLGIPNDAVPIVFGLLGATAVVGLGWNWRVWALAAVAFYIPYVLLYTTFLTEIDGFGSGIWGSLDYWLDQQRLDEPRGNQPWFYYFMLLPTYEFLPLLIAAPALFYYAVRGDVFRRFLVAWVVGAWAAYIWAGEKMPWLSVHTTLPVVVLAAYALGDVFSRLPDRHRLERIAPQALPFVAAAFGLAAVAFAAFGPTDGGWVVLRILAVVAALGGVLWLLRPYDRRRLASGLLAAVVGGLALFTVYTGINATYKNGDVPEELLVYTQTAPHVPDVMDRIEEAGRVSGLGKDVPIFVDTTYAWPWHWYLRDYTRVSFASVGPEFTPEPDTILLLAAEQEATIQPYLDQYQTPIRHPLRWWFPEFSTYKTLPTARNDIPEFAGEFVGDLFRAGAWENWWSFFRDRETGYEIGQASAVAYFPLAYPVTEAPPPDTTVSDEPLPPPAIDSEGRFVMGEAGSRPGAFAAVSGLTVDARGNIYVADTDNHRIQQFGPDGAFIKQVGGFGNDLGRFNQPADVAIDGEGFIYAVDTWNHRIQKLDAELNPVTAFGLPAGDLDNPNPDQMWGPRAIAVDIDGNLLVADTGTARIKLFSPEGQVLNVFGERGSDVGQFSEPVGLAVAPNGEVWVADVGNARLQRFDADFNVIASYPVAPWSDLNPDNKPYLTILRDGHLLASDAPGGQILLIGSDGNIVETLPSLGPTQFAYPRGLASDGDFVYVTEPLNGQVLRLPLSDLSAP